MPIYDKLTYNGTTITDVSDVKVTKSISDNNSSSTFSANIDNFDGKNATTYTIGDEMIVYADKDTNPPTTKIFTGILENIKFPSKSLRQNIILSGRDYTARMMDRTVEPEVYTNLPAGSIVKDIITKYTDDITLTNTSDSPTTIARIAFNHTPVYDAVKKLAQLSDYTFYVDNDKDLHFKEKSSTSSGKTFSSGNIIKADIKEQRNTVYNEIWVYGDRYLDSIKEEFTADGTGSVFTLGYRPHNTNIDVGSPITLTTRQKGAIENVSVVPASGTDYLVNYFDRKIIFVSGTTLDYSSIPAVDTLVTADYQRSLPIVKVGRDQISIDKYGKRIKKVVDKEIKDPDTAHERMVRELSENSIPKKQGTLNIRGVVDVTPSETAVIDLPHQNVSNQTYDILEAKYDFNKRNNLTEQVLSLKVNKKIDDVTDTIKDLISDVRAIQSDDISDSDILTRFEWTTGSLGIRQSGCVVSSRTIGSSFILGHAIHGVLGSPAPTYDSSTQVVLGDSRSAFTINFSGGYPSV